MIFRLLLALALVAAVFVAGLFGGGGLVADQSLVGDLAVWRGSNPETTSALILLTQLGGAPVLLTLAALAAIPIARRNRMAAVALIGTVLGGRFLIELMKLAVNRPRPAIDSHAVSVFSQSFPSGHAGNSIMTYGAIALFALPQRWRAAGLTAAVALSAAVGATRPILGVHWPSDVIGGWCLGALWLLVCWTVWKRPRRLA
jgi:membrane-associated phospholipid phosphatase